MVLNDSDITVYPQADDFDNSNGNKYTGRVMISTYHDDQYYFDNATTTNNQHAQTEDGKVTITTVLPCALAGAKVYFRVRDPDDASPYDVDSDGDDNKGNHPKGKFIVEGGTVLMDEEYKAWTYAGQYDPLNNSYLCTGNTVSAEITLQFANSGAPSCWGSTECFGASGNNYIVEASLEPNFTTCLSTTTTMTAWKRIYYETYRMYEKGATIMQVELNNSPLVKDKLFVDDASDIISLGAGQHTIEIFNKAGSTIIATIENIETDVQITEDHLEDIPNNTTVFNPILDVISINSLGITSGIDTYDGIRLVGGGNQNTLNDNIDFVDGYEKAYGNATSGSDKGAFIEIKGLPIEITVPKYKKVIRGISITGAPDIEGYPMSGFLGVWATELSAPNKVVFIVSFSPENWIILNAETNQLVNFTPSAYANSNFNYISLFTVMCPLANRPQTCVHEFGHILDLKNNSIPHVDNPKPGVNPIYRYSVSIPEYCAMSYLSNQTNSIIEFDYIAPPCEGNNLECRSCISFMRPRLDPI